MAFFNIFGDKKDYNINIDNNEINAVVLKYFESDSGNKILKDIIYNTIKDNIEKRVNYISQKSEEIIEQNINSRSKKIVDQIIEGAVSQHPIDNIIHNAILKEVSNRTAPLSEIVTTKIIDEARYSIQQLLLGVDVEKYAQREIASTVLNIDFKSQMEGILSRLIGEFEAVSRDKYGMKALETIEVAAEKMVREIDAHTVISKFAGHLVSLIDHEEIAKGIISEHLAVGLSEYQYSLSEDIDERIESAVSSAIAGEKIEQRVAEQVDKSLSAPEIRSSIERNINVRAVEGLAPLFETAIADMKEGNEARLLAAARQAIERMFPADSVRPILMQAIQAHAESLKDTALSLVGERYFPVARPDHEQHGQFEQIGQIAESRTGSVLMVGPAGSGKTHIAEQIAARMGLAYEFNGPVQSEYKLTGYKDATGNYHSTPFRRAYEYGGVYLFDELDACSPQALIAFNMALSNDVCDFPDKTVPKHADFICLAAANTFGRGANMLYTRNQLDAATLDRYIVVAVDYDVALERKLARNDDWVDKIIRWRRNIKEIDEGRIHHVISMRASIFGARLLRLGLSEDEVERMVVWRGLDPNTVVKIKRS